MEDYLVSATRRLVAADTVSDLTSAPLLAWIADELERRGFRCRLQEYEEAGAAKPNLVAWAGPAEPGGLALSGHIDVVPYAGQPGWTREPLALCLEGGRAYGRGTSDMKGFIALCLDAAQRLDPASLARPLVFLFTSDEEVGCRGAARLAPALASLLEDIPPPRWCWIGEPTSWRVFHCHKGIVEFEVEVHGRGGHSGVPEAGANAIAIAARAIAEVGAVQARLREVGVVGAREEFPDSPYTTFNFGGIQGGTASNMIAERCRFGVSYRPLPGTDPLAPWQEVRERLAALAPLDFGSAQRGAVAVGEPFVVPGMRSARGSALEVALASELGGGSGGGAPYCTDAGHLAAAGIESLICGPGDLEQAHQPDESIGLSALERGRVLLPRLIERLCGGPPCS